MLSHIKGILTDKTSSLAVIEAGGVGFEINVSPSTLSALPETGREATLYTYMSVREDAMELFGFVTRDEKRMFMKLISVSGIGPKTALGILGVISPADLSVAIVTGDASRLAKAPGIGKKTAQRLILELKEKVSESDLISSPGAPVFVPKAQSAQSEAIEALMALGYTSSEAAGAVGRTDPSLTNVNDIIMQALRSLGS
jgi:Holliday junction DNA helicase RuvA